MAKAINKTISVSLFGKYAEGIGLLVGMTFGAGVFALPYTFHKAGLFWGIFFFLFALFVIIVSHLLYGEIVFFLKDGRRFTGYAELLLGKEAKVSAFIVTVFSYYGSLLIYGLLGGIFLSHILTGVNLATLTILFFASSSLLVVMRLKTFAGFNLYLTVPLVGFVFYLLYSAWPLINSANFLAPGINLLRASWFLPFGVWLFALGGYSSLPEVRELFKNLGYAHFRKVILFSFTIIIFSYFLFIASIWGVSGQGTTEDALSGIVQSLGTPILIVGSLIGLLAVLTSFLAVAEDMQYVFKYDYRMPPAFAWFFTVTPPLVLYASGVQNFTRVLGFIGTIGMGIFAFFVVLMSKSMRLAIIERPEVFETLPARKDLLKQAPLYEAVMLIGVGLACFYELYRLF